MLRRLADTSVQVLQPGALTRVFPNSYSLSLQCHFWAKCLCILIKMLSSGLANGVVKKFSCLLSFEFALVLIFRQYDSVSVRYLTFCQKRYSK